MRYALKGDSKILEYFLLDKETGDITLRKALTADKSNRKEYKVNI